MSAYIDRQMHCGTAPLSSALDPLGAIWAVNLVAGQTDLDEKALSFISSSRIG
jgi:hypothetical protein